MRALHLNCFNKFLTQILLKLCHHFLGTNRPEGWVRTDRKWVRNVLARVRNVHGYETTGKIITSMDSETSGNSLAWAIGKRQISNFSLPVISLLDIIE